MNHASRSETTTGGPELHAPRRRAFGERLMAALRLESELYEEVEHDPHALGQAASVVALAGIASAFGALGTIGAPAILSGLLAAFLGWLLWTALVWAVGVQVFHHTSDFQELLRTLGFVSAPQLLYVFVLIPVAPLQWAIVLAVAVMTAIAFVRAVRQALDVDTGRALFVSGLCLVAYLALVLVLGAIAS